MFECGSDEVRDQVRAESSQIKENISDKVGIISPFIIVDCLFVCALSPSVKNLDVTRLSLVQP